ncbi:CapA family protein [Bacillus massiliigorillae]|uniref:CapA family protein n=1 Tax=Bacillus massiliigorillae TaxID=1243664 RepID=UPI0009DDBCAD|nr:CapA family protein [Bacillus massiliigorillae]
MRSLFNGLLLVIICLVGFTVYYMKDSSERTESVVKDETKVKDDVKKDKPKPEKEKAITISAAGDFTLGRDETYAYIGSLPDEAAKNGLPYFVEKFDDIFKKDDLTTVNLEGPLTNATQKAVKKFRFKGDPSYAQILTLGGIESVNLANNHSYDYLQKGFDDTIATLEQNKIGYFGYDHQYVTTVKGVKIGVLGYEGWDDTLETRAIVETNIKKLRDQGVQIVLVHFHWGDERHYVPNESQKSLAHFTIDSGADLVLGHHPHVLQGIEEYNGKFIVYSLGNFMFGGNKNPADKDTFVFQQTFHLKGDKLTDKKQINVVPFSISSVPHRNNYQSSLLKGPEAERVKNKIIDASNKINGSDWLKYEVQ